MTTRCNQIFWCLRNYPSVFQGFRPISIKLFSNGCRDYQPKYCCPAPKVTLSPTPPLEIRKKAPDYKSLVKNASVSVLTTAKLKKLKVLVDLKKAYEIVKPKLAVQIDDTLPNVWFKLPWSSPQKPNTTWNFPWSKEKSQKLSPVSYRFKGSPKKSKPPLWSRVKSSIGQFMLKTLFTGCVIYSTLYAGVWGTTDESVSLYNQIKSYIFEEYVPGPFGAADIDNVIVRRYNQNLRWLVCYLIVVPDMIYCYTNYILELLFCFIERKYTEYKTKDD